MLSISRLTDTALASAVYASREALPLPCKTCFRLAGCAFSGRVSNPLDHDRRFLVTFPSSFSGLCLTLAQFDCKNTAYGIIMGSSGWQVVHCPGFHQYLLCTGGDLTPWVGSSFPPATPCIGTGKRRLCTAHTPCRHRKRGAARYPKVLLDVDLSQCSSCELADGQMVDSGRRRPRVRQRPIVDHSLTRAQ